MSATKDKNQRFTFVYKDFYKAYKESQKMQKSTTATKGVVINLRTEQVNQPFTQPSRESSNRVLKVGEQRSGQTASSVKVREYKEPELVAKRVETAQIRRDLEKKTQRLSVGPLVRPLTRNKDTVQDLKNNLKSLQDLHSRLRFMLNELEDLIKD